MKRSDMWERPTVNGKLRAHAGTQRVFTAAQQAGFVGLGGFSLIERPAIERILKKSIPLLIIAFLISVAAARGLSLISSHERMEDAVRQATELTSAMALAALEDEPRLFDPASAAETAQELNALVAAGSDTDLVVIDTAGTVLAATGASASLTGRPLAAVFPELTSARPSRSSGGVVETHINGVPYQVSMHLAGSDGGMVIALHSMQTMNALWRAEINLNVTLFAAMAMLLLVVVYAYYAQLNRADHTTELMLENEARRDGMLANGETGLWSFDPQAGLTFLDGSAAMALGLGTAPRQLDHKQMLALIHPDDRAGFFRRFAPADTGLIEASFRLRQHDGRYTRIDIRAHAGQTDGRIAVSGTAIRTASASRREVETATKRASLYQAAFDAMPQALALWGKDGRLELANASFAAAYGVDGSARRDSLVADDAVVVRRICGDNAVSSEVRTPAGHWQAVSESRLPNGALLTVGSDITAFKSDECRLQGEQARLREKVAALAAARRRLELKCAALNRALGRDIPVRYDPEAELSSARASRAAGTIIRKTVA
ncbi:PAS domain-containing protein [Martelella sp. FLE1502]